MKSGWTAVYCPLLLGSATRHWRAFYAASCDSRAMDHPAGNNESIKLDAEDVTGEEDAVEEPPPKKKRTRRSAVRILSKRSQSGRGGHQSSMDLTTAQ